MYTSTVYVQTSATHPIVYTTVYVAGAAATTANNILNGVYCSTVTAKGPNLPTTRAGACGTILVVSGGPSVTPSTSLLILGGAWITLLAYWGTHI